MSAAGTMAWELLCLGVPSALVVAADDQYAPARIIDAAGAAVVLGTDEDAVTGEFAGLEALFDPSARRASASAAAPWSTAAGPHGSWTRSWRLDQPVGSSAGSDVPPHLS